MWRKPLVVVLCTLALLVGTVAFAAPARAASGGGCSLQTIPVQACISIDGAGHVVADFYRNSSPPNCYQINLQLGYPSHLGFPLIFSCSTYHGVLVDSSSYPPGTCINNHTTMYYSDGSYRTEVRSPESRPVSSVF